MRRGQVVVVGIAAVLLLGASSARACVSPRRVPIASGPSPSGEDWNVSAGIKKNGTCHEWLFEVDFSLPHIVNWGSATGIPVGGHTSRYFTISASDNSSLGGSERVLSGYTGREAAVVVATMKDGRRMEIHPRFPPVKLRKQFVWLRSFRYFVHYYPPGSSVESVSLFNRAGTLLYRTKGEHGSFRVADLFRRTSAFAGVGPAPSGHA